MTPWDALDLLFSLFGVSMPKGRSSLIRTRGFAWAWVGLKHVRLSFLWLVSNRCLICFEQFAIRVLCVSVVRLYYIVRLYVILSIMNVKTGNGSYGSYCYGFWNS